jgi:hypothetical protein
MFSKGDWIHQISVQYIRKVFRANNHLALILFTTDNRLCDTRVTMTFQTNVQHHLPPVIFKFWQYLISFFNDNKNIWGVLNLNNKV